MRQIIFNTVMILVIFDAGQVYYSIDFAKENQVTICVVEFSTWLLSEYDLSFSILYSCLLIVLFPREVNDKKYIRKLCMTKDPQYNTHSQTFCFVVAE